MFPIPSGMIFTKNDTLASKYPQPVAKLQGFGIVEVLRANEIAVFSQEQLLSLEELKWFCKTSAIEDVLDLLPRRRVNHRLSI